MQKSNLQLKDEGNFREQEKRVHSSSSLPKIDEVHSEQKQSATNIIISSALAGCAARLALHPIDTIKARMQVQITNPEISSKLSSAIFEGGANTNGGNQVYRNTFHAITSMTKYEGARSFYKGLGASLIFTGPAITLYLTSYEYCKKKLYIFGNYLKEKNGDSLISRNLMGETALVHLASGLAAESLSCVFWVPHDVLKERLQVQRSNEINLTQLMKIVRKDGFLQLYKGYWITLASFGPFSAIYFLTYERMKELFQKQTSQQTLPFSTTLLCGAIGAGFGSFCTLPLDVIKTRFQVQRRMKMQNIAFEEDIMYYKNFGDAVRKIIKYEGPTAFWKGFTSRIVYAAPNSALIMALFELFKQKFDFI